MVGWISQSICKSSIPVEKVIIGNLRKPLVVSGAMSDISDFLQSYNETLRQGIAGADMPPGLTERFDFDSCVKRQDGREVYFVTQKTAGRRGVLCVTDTSSGENAGLEGAVMIYMVTLREIEGLSLGNAGTFFQYYAASITNPFAVVL